MSSHVSNNLPSEIRGQAPLAQPAAPRPQPAANPQSASAQPAPARPAPARPTPSQPQRTTQQPQKSATVEKTAKTKAESSPAAETAFEEESHGSSWRDLLASGLFSMMFHIVVLLVLALWWLPGPETKDKNDNLIVSRAESVVEDEELFDDSISLEDPLEEVVEETLDPAVTPVEFEESTEAISSDFEEAAAAESAPTVNIPLETTIGPLAAEIATTVPLIHGGSALSGRGKMQRMASVRKNGGTLTSEAAVESALAWIAAHQNADGSWSIDHRHGGKCQCGNPGKVQHDGSHGFGATGLALLPYLGAGYTHRAGKYKETVARGLHWILANLKADSQHGYAKAMQGDHAMYGHGLATLVLTEAYGLTGDQRLRAPAQAAVNWIVVSQTQRPQGLWDYHGGGADTSVAGWQVMALKSAHSAGFDLPDDIAARVHKGLDFVQAEGGAAYGYRGPAPFAKHPATSAAGLLCRIHTGWPREHAGLATGMSYIAKSGPWLKGEGPELANLYYTYYATQAIFQYTDGKGPQWERYNTVMREALIASQAKEGHERGSWGMGQWLSHGGRLYSTSMACMCLEVYYRYMPVYKSGGLDRKQKHTPVFDEAEAWDLE